MPLPSARPMLPLYVDLDGTLVRSDTLHESLLLLLRANPLNVFRLMWWVLGGKAAFKRRVAQAVRPDAATLPYHTDFLAWLRELRGAGRPLYLATAADAHIAHDVAQHLQLFDGVLATNMAPECGHPSPNPGPNLSRSHKRSAIEHHAQAQGHSAYAYAGNSRDDLAVWAGAAEAVAVNTPAGVLRQLQRQHPEARVFEGAVASLRTWLKAIRITQWAKNGLLFVPLLAAHELNLALWVTVAWSFLAFGLCASATYLINDLLDLPNDRRHRIKRHRPLAAGRIGTSAAVRVLVLMMLAAFALALWASPVFAAMLALYTAITLAYSLFLKRVALLDVLVLSGLYTLRIGAGALVAGVELSNWLLVISLFLFLGLALVKRCAELEEVLLDTEVSSARGRGYHQDDLPALRAMGVASGFFTVMVLALYIDSQNGRELYAQPEWLWGAIPLLLWWIMRIWLKTGRRELHGEDPLQFALHDRFSWFTVAAIGVLAAVATYGL
jgi:4-hydroxybenzoate polyprenyltransferase